jgi:hypothetical protein
MYESNQHLEYQECFIRIVSSAESHLHKLIKTKIEFCLRASERASEIYLNENLIDNATIKFNQYILNTINKSAMQTLTIVYDAENIDL